MNKDILLELLGEGKEHSLDEHREYQCAEFRAEGIEQLSYQRRNPEVAVIIFDIFLISGTICALLCRLIYRGIKIQKGGQRMPIMLKRKDGSITRFRNAEFIPAFYILPKSIIDLCGTECQVIPRNPKLLLASWEAIKFVESDLFLEIIMDSYHYLIWPFMMPGEKREIYSGYEPAWRLSYAIPMWLKGFTDAGYLPTAKDFLQNAPYAEIGYVSEEELSAVLSVVVPSVMAENNLQPIIDIAKKYRCFEDFDYRSSRQKTDFYRQWYHTRTKHPLISLECFMEDYAESHDGEEWEIHDKTQDFEEHVLAEIEVNRFLETLTDKDRQILELRMKGQPLEEIAERLGYKTHSAVLKRIRKIGKAYEKYAGVDYGFSEKRIV